MLFTDETAALKLFKAAAKQTANLKMQSSTCSGEQSPEEVMFYSESTYNASLANEDFKLGHHQQ